jgi:hypothetical protein
METDANLYQNAQFRDAGSGGYLKAASRLQSLAEPTKPRLAPEPPKSFPKIDELKQQTDLS